MKRPGIGELGTRAVIARWRDVPMDGSATASSYDPVATVWAKVEAVGGAIYLGSIQVGDTITHRITIRRRTDVTARHVIEAKGRRYRVRRATDLQERFTVLDCEEEGTV